MQREYERAASIRANLQTLLVEDPNKRSMRASAHEHETVLVFVAVSLLGLLFGWVLPLSLFLHCSCSSVPDLIF